MLKLVGLGRAFVALFAISTAFPIVASLVEADALPRLVGVLDVVVAALTIVVGLLLETRARDIVTAGHRATAWRILRLASSAILGLLVVFFVAPDAVAWPVLVLGLAWRTWLIVWILPSVVASLQGSSERSA